MTFIDTARNYGTEEAVGMGIRGRRSELFLSTKSNAGRGERLVTAAELAATIEDSLRKLATGHIDVYHLHGVTLAQYAHCVQVLLPELKRAAGGRQDPLHRRHRDVRRRHPP